MATPSPSTLPEGWYLEGWRAGLLWGGVVLALILIILTVVLLVVCCCPGNHLIDHHLLLWQLCVRAVEQGGGGEEGRTKEGRGLLRLELGVDTGRRGGREGSMDSLMAEGREQR